MTSGGRAAGVARDGSHGGARDGGHGGARDGGHGGAMTAGNHGVYLGRDHGGTGVGRLTFANDLGRGSRIRMGKGLVLIIETPVCIT